MKPDPITARAMQIVAASAPPPATGPHEPRTPPVSMEAARAQAAAEQADRDAAAAGRKRRIERRLDLIRQAAAIRDRLALPDAETRARRWTQDTAEGHAALSRACRLRRFAAIAAGAGRQPSVSDLIAAATREEVLDDLIGAQIPATWTGRPACNRQEWLTATTIARAWTDDVDQATASMRVAADSDPVTDGTQAAVPAEDVLTALDPIPEMPAL